MANHTAPLCQENIMMNKAYENKTMSPTNESFRLEGELSATEEESRNNAGNINRNDGSSPKPEKGSHDPDADEKGNVRRLNTARIGTWNVRTLLDVGKIHLLTQELRRLKCNICGVSETRWSGKGHFTTLGNSHTIYFSGKETRGTEGVAILIDQKTNRHVMGYNPISERLISIRVNARPTPITILQCYAPTSAADEDTCDNFYDELQQAIDSTPNKDILVIMGDFNAKVGTLQTNKEVMGKYGLGERNNRGQKLVEFCEQNHLWISNTQFKHHPRRTYTWTAPNNIHRNQIDYIMISKRWKTNINNCKAYPGADCDSDHNMVMATWKMKLKRINKDPLPLRYDLENIGNEYITDIRNRFEMLIRVEEERTPDEIWEAMKNNIIEAANIHIPKKKKIKKQPWITKDTIELAQKKRKAKSRGTNSDQYKELKMEVKRACRKDKKLWIEGMCAKLEEQAKRNNSKGLFEQVKELRGEFSPKAGSIKASNGTLLTEDEHIKQRWVEYTKKLYEVDPNVTQLDTDLGNEKEPEPLLSEVDRAIKKVKSGKAPGLDCVPIELIKAGGDKAVTIFHKLCCKIWKDESWPTDWRTSEYVPIPKKGDLQRCENYRTIALISHASKVLLIIILERIKNIIEKEIAEEQAGFRSGRGTRDHLHNLRTILEKTIAHDQTTFICFIDYSKAFDCTDYTHVWHILNKLGFPKHIIRLIKQLYEQQEASIRVNTGNTEKFKTGKGVRQGCILSPYLFNTYTEHIMREAITEADGISIQGKKISNLRYADDTALISNSEDNLQEMVTKVSRASNNHGLYLNAKKTKVMAVSKNRTNIHIVLNNERLEQVNSYKYLGASITEEGTCTTEIRARLAMARASMLKLANIWNDKNITKSMKIRLIKALIWPIATYGCESWTINQREEAMIQAFELWIYRRLLQVTYKEHKTNNWILEQVGQAPQLLNIVKRQKLSYFGHVKRAKGLLENTIMEGRIDGSRPRGRQRTQWIDNIRTWMRRSAHEAGNLARNRKAYRHDVINALSV